MDLLLLAAALLGSPQDPDPPRLTLEKSGTFRSLADEISKKFKEEMKVEANVEDKTVELRVRDAGFFEAVDALCRAHGAVTYLVEDFRRWKEREEEGLVLWSGTWVEYPASYSGNLKTIISSFTRLKSLSEKESRTWIRVRFELFAPPSLSVDRGRGWEVTEAVDGKGGNVRPPKEELEPDEIVRISSGKSLKYANDGEIHLRDFDLGKGLKKIEGTVSVETARRVQVRLPLDVGAKAETPYGVLRLNSMQEIKTAKGGSLWLAGLNYEGRGAEDPKISRLFDSRVRFDDGEEQYSNLYLDQKDFQIKTRQEGPRPKALFLKARAGLSTVNVPFSFTDVVFKGK